jgi:hypothetical protein
MKQKISPAQYGEMIARIKETILRGQFPSLENIGLSGPNVEQLRLIFVQIRNRWRRSDDCRRWMAAEGLTEWPSQRAKLKPASVASMPRVVTPGCEPKPEKPKREPHFTADLLAEHARRERNFGLWRRTQEANA